MFAKLVAIPLLLFTDPVFAQEPILQCLTPLDVAGTPERMQERDFSTIIHLKNAPLAPLAIAYGPGRDPTGEITAVDGHYYVARAENGRIITAVDPADQGAAMLVRAAPSAWLEAAPLTGITGLQSLNAALAARIEALGCAGNVTMPFRITAKARSLTWSVDAAPESVRGTITDTDVIIVGVFSNHDRSRSFMARGLDLHAHMLVPGSGMSGHIGAVALADGATVQLAAAAPATGSARAAMERDFDAYLEAFDYDERVAMKIGLNELLTGYARGEIQLIDIRFPEEHAAWSVGIGEHIPLNELPARLNELDARKTIVTMCPHNDRSAMARHYLTLKSYRARYLSDGMLKLVDFLRGDRARDYMAQLQRAED